jgi:hypothetical protein
MNAATPIATRAPTTDPTTRPIFDDSARSKQNCKLELHNNTNNTTTYLRLPPLLQVHQAMGLQSADGSDLMLAKALARESVVTFVE